MNEEEIIKKYHAALAKKGGIALREKKGVEYFSALGKRSAEAKAQAKKEMKKKLSTSQHLTDQRLSSRIQVSNKSSKKLAK